MKNSTNLAQKLYREKYLKPDAFLSKNKVQTFMNNILGIIFPEIGLKSYKNEDELYFDLSKSQQELNYILQSLKPEASLNSINSISEAFFSELGNLNDTLLKDANFVLQQDPATNCVEEIIICYPGFYAISSYRLAHFFQKQDVKIFPRLISELARQKTGIDIHPSAEIQSPFFIDHGTGVVIGETSVIGKNVKIYQGATLGSLHHVKAVKGQKRHPTLEDDVCVYANASILGGETVIGKGAIIGGNVVITESVSAYSQIYFSQEKIIKTMNSP